MARVDPDLKPVPVRSADGPKASERAQGLQETFLNHVRTNAVPLLENLGTHFRLLESGFKPHAACRYAHGPIDAAIRLMRSTACSPAAMSTPASW